MFIESLVHRRPSSFGHCRKDSWLLAFLAFLALSVFLDSFEQMDAKWIANVQNLDFASLDTLKSPQNSKEQLQRNKERTEIVHAAEKVLHFTSDVAAELELPEDVLNNEAAALKRKIDDAIMVKELQLQALRQLGGMQSELFGSFRTRFVDQAKKAERIKELAVIQDRSQTTLKDAWGEMSHELALQKKIETEKLAAISKQEVEFIKANMHPESNHYAAVLVDKKTSLQALASIEAEQVVVQEKLQELSTLKMLSPCCEAPSKKRRFSFW